jgi:hypothetical protein
MLHCKNMFACWLKSENNGEELHRGVNMQFSYGGALPTRQVNVDRLIFTSVPLIPKFASEVPARICELRNRDTSQRARLFDVGLQRDVLKHDLETVA